ncbi:hypothetical protein ACFL5M_07235, partial [Candidatus Neomarinimicrobiota bacterium]
SHNQQGGITAYQVNIQPGDRVLDGSQLQSKLDEHQFNDIRIKTAWGDQEAFRFATQTKNYLVANGYSVKNIVHAMYSKPIQGQHINPVGDDGVLEIVIGGR